MNLEKNIVKIPIESIIPNRFQPRLNFEDRGLEELADSIRQHGIIQPLVVRRIENKYEIIAGERRYKAATIAGLSEVPAIVANIDDNKSAEVAIVENVQRRDLTAIEEARSYKNLLDKGYLTQSELAKKMGLSQSAIANKLRLLNLDEQVQEALLKNEISERHARSLLILPTHELQIEWLKRIINERMTVRDLDAALKNYLASQANEPEEEKEEPDIPLVRSLDIDAIKKSATELPQLEGESEIARKLREIEQEKMFNPEIVPVEQATNKAKNNFFNFLEEEKVNMNTEEFDIKAPAIDLTTSVPPKKTEPPREASFAPPAGVGPTSKENYVPQEEEATFDPVNLIDQLDNDYVEPKPSNLNLDLKSAINEIRNTKDNLSEQGFNISLEETDADNIYQFIIKIQKN